MTESALLAEGAAETKTEQPQGEQAPTTQTQPAPQTQATEPAKPAESKPAETPKPEGAPEQYADFTVPAGLPDGYALDPKVSEAVKTVARELNLPQTSAQKLIDSVLPTMHARVQEQERAIHEQWIAQSKADPEIGGSKLDENLGIAKRALNAFATDGLKQLLNGPLGSHPDVVRFLVKVGRTVSEDAFVGGERRSRAADLNDEAAIAAKFYPNTPKA